MAHAVVVAAAVASFAPAAAVAAAASRSPAVPPRAPSAASPPEGSGPHHRCLLRLPAGAGEAPPATSRPRSGLRCCCCWPSGPPGVPGAGWSGRMLQIANDDAQGLKEAKYLPVLYSGLPVNSNIVLKKYSNTTMITKYVFSLFPLISYLRHSNFFSLL